VLGRSRDARVATFPSGEGTANPSTASYSVAAPLAGIESRRHPEAEDALGLRIPLSS
jgi:hypothetical protein